MQCHFNVQCTIRSTAYGLTQGLVQPDLVLLSALRVVHNIP